MLHEVGKRLIEQIDELMPAIEKAIAAEWDQGNYFNGPQFGATLEEFRRALETAGNEAANAPQHN